MVISNGGEPRSYLVLQLRFVTDLLLMSSLLAHSHRAYSPFLASLQKAVKTYINLCETEQSFLVHALEWLDIPADIERRAKAALDSALESITNGVHALLLFDSKIVLYEHNQGRIPALTADELRLLVVLATSALPPEEAFDPSNPTRLVETLYIKPNYQSVCVMFARVAARTTLVIAAAHKDMPEAASVQSDVMRKLAPYADFILAKGSRHLPMMSWLLTLPGIVHFIYVNRTANRVIAPGMDPLCNATASPEEQALALESLHSNLWEFVYMAQQQHGQGYVSGIFRLNNRLCSYRYWSEDEKGTEVPPDSPLAVRGLELYTLYAGGVSTETIESHNAALLQSLQHLQP